MFWQAVAALTPMVCVALLFWFAMRAVVNADHRERVELAKLEAADAAAADRAASAKESDAGDRTAH